MEKMLKLYKMLIGGKWVESSSRQRFEVRNPANGELLGTVPKGNEQDADAAVRAARKAFDSGVWSEMTPAERSSILWKLADLLEIEVERFALLESKNVGKTIRYSREADFPFVIDNLRFFATAARMLEGVAAGEYVDFHYRRHHKGLGTSIIRREPIGVVAGIVPWNYPLYIAIWKLAPALAVGNTLVIKPASYTPLTLLEFGELAQRAGIPAGVLNIVTGPGEVIGQALATHSEVDMVSLTGDTGTGKKIMAAAAGTVKKLHLELGGKAPFIILEDADLEAAAQGAVVAGFWNTGQDCTAATRIYIPAQLEKKFLKLLLKEVNKIKLGDPQDKKTDMGPLVSEKQRERVEAYIHSGTKQGAKLVYGGRKPKGKEFEKGFFLEPAVFADVKQHMQICQEEIFGPVLAVLTYRTVEEVIKKANDVIYGLAASVWGKDISLLMRIAKQLDFGTVWINEHGILASEMPHGGFKQSGFGKDLSLYSLEEYTRIKHVYIDLTEMKRKPWYYVVYGGK